MPTPVKYEVIPDLCVSVNKPCQFVSTKTTNIQINKKIEVINEIVEIPVYQRNNTIFVYPKDLAQQNNGAGIVGRFFCWMAFSFFVVGIGILMAL